MDKKAEKEKRYVKFHVSIKKAEDPGNDGYLEELIKRSKKYGAISITCYGLEIMVKGEDAPVLRLIAWLLRGSRKKRLLVAEMISEEKV
jgi:hypothetical protein